MSAPDDSTRGVSVAVIGNPASDKGRGAAIDVQVVDLLREAGRRYGFAVSDLTGTSFDDSLSNAIHARDDYDHLVVVGGDGMIALGANAVASSGKPLGIVAIGSGNDFARGLGLPVNRVQVAVEGIVGAIVRGSHIDVDMGRITRMTDGEAVDHDTDHAVDRASSSAVVSDASPRYYAGMLSCGVDAAINDRANHSRLPGGSLRYAAAAVAELSHLSSYGYHVRATLPDGRIWEQDLVTPLLTVANARYIGGGIEVSPYSLFDDGLLDLVWARRVPNLLECAALMRNAYNGRLLSSDVLGWRRIRAIEITRSDEGDDPPTLMADGEYVGALAVRVDAMGRSLRVLVPPAVARDQSWRSERGVIEAIRRDGRLDDADDAADAESAA